PSQEGPQGRESRWPIRSGEKPPDEVGEAGTCFGRRGGGPDLWECRSGVWPTTISSLAYKDTLRECCGAGRECCDRPTEKPRRRPGDYRRTIPVISLYPSGFSEPAREKMSA